MLSSLLNAITINSLILDIFIILAVVIAGALIFYFMWEAFNSSIANRKNREPRDDDYKFDKEEKGFANYSLDQEEQKQLEAPAEENVAVANLESVSLENAEEQPAQAENVEQTPAEEPQVEAKMEEYSLEDKVVPSNFDESAVEDVNLDKAEQEKAQAEDDLTDEERENAQRRAYLEARRQELLRRLQEETEEEESEEETEQVSEENNEQEETEDNETETEETQESDKEETEADEVEEAEEAEEAESQADETEETEEELEEEPEEEQEPETNELAAEEAALQEEREALAVEKARYETMIAELENARRALAESQAAAAAATAAAAAKPEPKPEPQSAAFGLSLSELKEKLAEAEKRLAQTEKEFKQVKKEYIPLQKVWAMHDKDERKLRRKEALVARQKVLLYGVNNYADIDEEKAKKLAEDLDLLDGLKLSVQHCEEVMKNNEERYPLLEKMYKVLKFRNDEIKKDIEKYTAEIERLESEQE